MLCFRYKINKTRETRGTFTDPCVSLSSSSCPSYIAVSVRTETHARCCRTLPVMMHGSSKHPSVTSADRIRRSCQGMLHTWSRTLWFRMLSSVHGGLTLRRMRSGRLELHPRCAAARWTRTPTKAYRYGHRCPQGYAPAGWRLLLVSVPTLDSGNTSSDFISQPLCDRLREVSTRSLKECRWGRSFRARLAFPSSSWEYAAVSSSNVQRVRTIPLLTAIKQAVHVCGCCTTRRQDRASLPATAGYVSNASQDG